MDLPGGKVTLYCTNGSTFQREITEEMVSGFDNTVAGKQTLTVTIGNLMTTYEIEIITATVVFKNYDGIPISTAEYMYGDEIVIPDNPVKESDNTYTYSFADWDKEVVACEGPAVYTATYDAEYIEYTVTFKNWNGDIISQETYHYGDEVVIPENPTRESDDNVSYIFIGWDIDVSDLCTGNATYTAVFTNGIFGDVTGDGKINTIDLIRMKKYISGADVDLEVSFADVTVDGTINALDLIRLKAYISGADVVRGQ